MSTHGDPRSSTTGRVLLLSDVTGHGGTTKYLDQMARAALAEGWECSVLLDEGPGTDVLASNLYSTGARLMRLPLYHGRYTDAQIGLSVSSALGAYRPDVVHVTCGSVRSCIAASEGVLAQEIPLIITEQYVSRLTTVSSDQIARLRSIHSAAYAVIAVSHENRVLLSRDFGLESRRLIVIPNAVRIPERLALAHRESPRQFVTVTRLTYQKGVDTLLMAMSAIGGLSARLTVIGDGELRGELEALARALSLSHITFAGWSDEASQQLDRYDLFVLPSRAEGLPFALIEALAQGLPCIATRVSGNPEALGDGLYGDLVSPDRPDQLSAAIRDFVARPWRLREMSAASQDHLRANHDVAANMRRVLTLWTTAMAASDKAEQLRMELPKETDATKTGTGPRLLIAVVSTNDGPWLGRCFDALSRSTFTEFDLVLIDNACEDETAAIAASAPLAVSCVSVTQRLSFAEANNVALRLAVSRGCRYAMLLNPDTQTHPNALRLLVDFMDSNAEFGIAGSWQATYGDDNWINPNDWTSQMLNGANVALLPDTLKSVHPVVECDYVQGAALLIRTALLERIGVLDTVYGTFYEETDLCRRCRLGGLRVGLVLSSRVQHQGGGHWRRSVEANRWRDILYLRNQLIYKLSEPDVTNWPIKRVCDIVRCQILSVYTKKEELVLPLIQYYQVVLSTVCRLRYIRDLRLRNRLILENSPIPMSLRSIGPASLTI